MSEMVITGQDGVEAERLGNLTDIKGWLGNRGGDPDEGDSQTMAGWENDPETDPYEEPAIIDNDADQPFVHKGEMPPEEAIAQAEPLELTQQMKDEDAYQAAQAEPDPIPEIVPDTAKRGRGRPPTGAKKLAERRTVSGHDPVKIVGIPMLPEGIEYCPGTRIMETIEPLIASFQELSPLKDYKVVAFWKNRVLKSKGKEEFGVALKSTGFRRYITGEPDYHIEMSIPNCQGLSNWQFEAAVYHLLKHCQELESTNINGEITKRPGIVAEDFSGFVDELNRYGLWSVNLSAGKTAYAQQLKLIGE